VKLNRRHGLSPSAGVTAALIYCNATTENVIARASRSYSTLIRTHYGIKN